MFFESWKKRILEHCYGYLPASVSEMTYTVSSGTLNSSIPYHAPDGNKSLVAYSVPQGSVLGPVLSIIMRPSMFENMYFMFFFSNFKKKHDFLRFFEMTYQKVVQSL